MKSKIIAILRGIKPNECKDIFDVLVDAGITRIEIPLNSPDPFTSIANMISLFGDKCHIGAGTVINAEQVKNLIKCGAHYIVSPNCDEEVIKTAIGNGLDAYPGVLTPSEMYNAIKWGASNLKLFPAGTLGISHFRAAKEILPPSVKVYAVGGINAQNYKDWFAAGIDGIGLGASIYKVGDSPEIVKEKISKFFDN